jgi:hypothetical protein
MERIIKLNGKTGLFDIPSFLLSDNEVLNVKLQTSEIRIGRYALTVKCGNEKKTEILGKDRTVLITPEWIKRGTSNILEFSLKLLNLSQSAVIRDGYEIEPLRVEYLDGDFEFTALVQNLHARQDEQHARLKKLEEIVAGIPTAIEQAKNEAIIEATGGDPMGA